jgi:hypothetical protein
MGDRSTPDRDCPRTPDLVPMELAAILTLLNIGLALRNVWKEWKARQGPMAHPLEPVLRDLVTAVRER